MMPAPVARCLLCILLCHGAHGVYISAQVQAGSTGGLELGSRAELLSNLTQQKTTGSFSCKEMPNMCQEPFNCDTFSSGPAIAGYLAMGLARNGHANPRTWCLASMYAPYADLCLGPQRDLVKAGKLQYKNTLEGKYGKYTAELDGSYCFIEGHCTNEAVTNSTTLEEAEEHCDRRYGHLRWTTFPSPISGGIGSALVPPADGGANGFKDKMQTEPFLVAACAMGNYHCDVMYCKETYCKNEYYVKKYGHFLKENGYDQPHNGYVIRQKGLFGR